MKRLRLALFFVFYAVAEVTLPHAAGPLEAAEEAVESLHLTRRLDLSRRASEWRAPAVTCSAVDVASAQPTMIPIERANPTAPVLVCKIPSASAESPSASEDH